MPKLYIDSANALGPLLLPAFPAGNSYLGVNTPFSSVNVYFANGQTDRILVPQFFRGRCFFMVKKVLLCAFSRFIANFGDSRQFFAYLSGFLLYKRITERVGGVPSFSAKGG
jgi:hypothetical protein